VIYVLIPNNNKFMHILAKAKLESKLVYTFQKHSVISGLK